MGTLFSPQTATRSCYWDERLLENRSTMPLDRHQCGNRAAMPGNDCREALLSRFKKIGELIAGLLRALASCCIHPVTVQCLSIVGSSLIDDISMELLS